MLQAVDNSTTLTVRCVVEQHTRLWIVFKTGSGRMPTPAVFWFMPLCVLSVCFWQVVSRLIFKERREPPEAGSRKYWLRYEAAILERSGWCEEFELWDYESCYVMTEKLEMGDAKKIAHGMLLFVCLWVVLCMYVLLCLLCVVIECNTFPLQSASLALTPMTSLFILPAPTLSSSVSSISLTYLSFLSYSPPCHFCPSFIYLFIDHCCRHCGYYTRPLRPHVNWPSAELPIILLLSLPGILIVQKPMQDFL